MYYFIYLLLQLVGLSARGPSANTGQPVGSGHLPVVVADAQGLLHLVYGQDSTIYYAAASSRFESPVAVATLPNLVAGAKRGPQVAVTDRYVVITAVNRTGDVFAYSLDRRTRHWSSATRINDVPAIAKEGFQAVAGASDGTFHAVWLDLRGDRQNKIVGTTSHDGGRTWSANQTIYRSPDGSVCECCRVSLTARGSDVYVQFRNWLGGSRDLYLAHSSDGGLTWAPAQKSGTGTWKLNACPMDGGAVVLTPSGQPLTAWRRDTVLYTCVPGQPEQRIIAGRNVTVAAGQSGTVLAWDAGGTVWLKSGNEPPIALGTGQMPSVAIVGQTALCVWEDKGQVMMRSVQVAGR